MPDPVQRQAGQRGNHKERREENHPLNPSAARDSSAPILPARPQPRVASSSHSTTMPQIDPAMSRMLRMRLSAIALASLSGGAYTPDPNSRERAQSQQLALPHFAPLWALSGRRATFARHQAGRPITQSKRLNNIDYSADSATIRHTDAFTGIPRTYATQIFCNPTACSDCQPVFRAAF